MRYPTKDRYFLEIYFNGERGPPLTRANIVKFIEADCDKAADYECSLILTSEGMCYYEDTKGSFVEIEGMKFFASFKQNQIFQFNDDNSPIWIRRPLTDEEMEKIAPFVI